MQRDLVLLTAMVCALFIASPAQADPDGGVARGYFEHLPDAPEADAHGTQQNAGNVLWIVVDAMRPDHLGCYGYTRPTTPFLDSIAKDSLVFVNAYSNAPWTRPSTASMLTGLIPSHHRTQTDKSVLPSDISTVAQDLKGLGYRTGAVVGNGNGSSVAGLQRGFDHYVDTVTEWDGLPDAEQVYASGLRVLDEMTADKQAKKDPFFLYLFLIDPHDPYEAPPTYEKEWLRGDKDNPRRRAHWEFQNDYPEAERESMISLYDASIRYVDDSTRKFFAELEKRGALENTTIIITADHGEGFGEHGYYLHAHHHYDEFVRVPLIVKSPALSGTGHVYHLVQLADLRATLNRAAGAKRAPRTDGIAIQDLLAKPVDPSRVIYTEFNEFGIRRSSAVSLKYRIILQLPAIAEAFDARIPDHKLLPSVSFNKSVVHIYDRVSDPRDTKSLSLRKAPADARAMYEDLETLMKATPESNIATQEAPPQIIEDLESLGYAN